MNRRSPPPRQLDGRAYDQWLLPLLLSNLDMDVDCRRGVKNSSSRSADGGTSLADRR